MPNKDQEVEGVKQSTGYEPVKIMMTQHGWGGLVSSTINVESIDHTLTYVDGSVGIWNWYYTIGTTKESASIPANSDSYVKEVYLFIRVSGIDLSMLCTKKRSQPKLPYFIIMLLT